VSVVVTRRAISPAICIPSAYNTLSFLRRHLDTSADLPVLTKAFRQERPVMFCRVDLRKLHELLTRSQSAVENAKLTRARADALLSKIAIHDRIRSQRIAKLIAARNESP
jgi:hypothetical protein